MNPHLFELYKRELLHAREMGGEFAAEFPKVAGRLGLETLECTDPYVERLLEGFAFLAARVQLKIESSQSQLARQLLEMIYPNYLSPTPSMLIAEVLPSLSEGSLAEGFTLKRGTRLRSQIAPDEQTECEYRTSHDLTLWPIKLSGFKYLPTNAALSSAGLAGKATVRSGIALEFETVGDITASELPMDEMSLYLAGADGLGATLYEQFMVNTKEVCVVCNGREVRSPRRPIGLERQGFEDDEALLPITHRGFQGYRLLQEYFAFSERFLFARLRGLKTRLSLCPARKFQIVFTFGNTNEKLFDLVSMENFKLNSVPAVNLFPKSADRIVLGGTQHQYHVIPDRTRPMDYEIHSIKSAIGYGTKANEKQTFQPYFSDFDKQIDQGAYFGIEREARLLSSKQKRIGQRSSYVGSEVFISLVDKAESPYRSDLKQLGIEALCTNRDLPLQMPVAKFQTDFSLDIGAPVDSIRCLSGPTRPKESRSHDKDAWRLVSGLTLNYLSLDSAIDDGMSSASMIRQMLELYADVKRGSDMRQLEGIVGVSTTPAVRQLKHRSHIEIARGMQINVRMDEAAFEGTGGVFVLGAVLQQFFTRYATMNSFTETVLESLQRNEIYRWPVNIGARSTL